MLTLARTQRLRLTFTGKFLRGLRFSKKLRSYELLKITLVEAEKNISTDPLVFSFFLSSCPLLFHLLSLSTGDSLNQFLNNIFRMCSQNVGLMSLTTN